LLEEPVQSPPIVRHAEVSVPSAIVFDHMGHVPQPEGLSHPVFNVVRRLVDKGRTWVKLSVTYDNTKDGPPGYADITKVAQAYIKAAPDRMVWGSNWPHPNETNKPDDSVLFDLISQFADRGRQRTSELLLIVAIDERNGRTGTDSEGDGRAAKGIGVVADSSRCRPSAGPAANVLVYRVARSALLQRCQI
jgi:hypothetical protein